MATYPQRAAAIMDAAVINGTSTTDQRTRAAAAFSDSAETFVREVRQFIVGRIRQYEADAAHAGVDATVDADIAADFPEAP